MMRRAEYLMIAQLAARRARVELDLLESEAMMFMDGVIIAFQARKTFDGRGSPIGLIVDAEHNQRRDGRRLVRVEFDAAELEAYCIKAAAAARPRRPRRARPLAKLALFGDVDDDR